MLDSITHNGKTITKGTKIRIIELDDKYAKSYKDVVGTVTLIDDMGYLHGTWGGLSIIPDIDNFEVLD